MTDVVLKKVPSERDTVIVNGKEHFLPSSTNIGYNTLNLQHDRTCSAIVLTASDQSPDCSMSMTKQTMNAWLL